MDNNFDDYEIAGLEAITKKHHNNYVADRQTAIDSINNVKSVQPAKSTGHTNNVRPARLTGHIDKSKNGKLSRKHLALAVAGVALTGIGLFHIVGRANSNPHELTTSDLMALSSNSENFNRLNLSHDNLQSVIDFSNKYQSFYDKIQDENFVLSDDYVHELQTYLDTYKTLSKSIIADKVSSVTDVDAKDIIVVDNSRDFPFVTIAVRGNDNGGSLLNVGPRFNTKPLPITFRNVAQNFVKLNNASVELNVDKFDDYVESLNDALGNLNTFAGSELIYDGKNFKEIYFDKDLLSHENNLNNSIQPHSDEITYTSYDSNDMDR